MLRPLFRQVDNSPLILFRMVFGLLLYFEAWGAILTGWVRKAFIEPAYTFPFIDFSWLHPLPGNGMYFYYMFMGIAGLMIMVGFYYRIGISLYAVMWSAVYLMQKTHYNNHYYLMMLLCFLMAIVPAQRYASFDASRNPDIKKLTCPQWCLWIFALQMTIIYLYASLAKMYPDWIAAKPIGLWFHYKRDYFLVGPLLAKEWFQHTVAYGGILFDLLIAPGLIWKKTRKYAFMAAIFFHLFNSAIFQVGVFPYMGIAISVFFFEPEVIRRIFFKKKEPVTLMSEDFTPVGNTPGREVLISFLSIYFVFQLLLPLRHRMFPGDVNWTEEGHRLSWHMMLRVKSGYVSFQVKDNDSKKEWLVSPQQYLTLKQSRIVAIRPDMCWQFVQIMKEDFASRGYPDISIYAKGMASLNGRPEQPIYDENVDLVLVKWSRFKHADWLVPLEK